MEKELSFEDKYQIILEKDTSYEGIFYTAVKTTGIFCRPSCTARKPKIENVLFYDTTHEAMINGFRPCKVCKPLEHKDDTPAFITELLNELKQNPQLRIKDYDLRQRSIAPEQVRRWFKKHHNMTFQGYQRMMRINAAYDHLTKGEQVTTTAFKHGYDSLSGFNASFQGVFGASPSKSEKKIINITRLTTPLGPMFACASEQGVCLLEFTNRRMLETEFKQITTKLNAVILPGTNEHLDQLTSELAEYFEGKRQTFDVPLDVPGTSFQMEVWDVLQDIPFGETRSYQQQAIAVGKPEAVRAVASANGCNRIAIVIPCHRVIGKDGKLTGYGGGLERKRWLLNHERAGNFAEQTTLFR